MPTTLRRSLTGLATLAIAVGGSACTSTEDTGDSDAGAIEVTASDDDCELSATDLDAGLHTFEVTNDGSQVTEFYVYAEGDRIMQEVENIGPGLTRELRVELPAGDYEGACKPGMIGDGIRTSISVTGEAAVSLSDQEELRAAEESYSRYVQTQSRSLVDLSQQFVDAVKAGDVEEAKRLFAIARTPWERIEPVAEIFGDLDPAVDARVNDVAEGDEWTGFHRIEQALWVRNTTEGMAPYADKLMADIRQVVKLAEQQPLTALQLAQGSKALLDEVATGKITGEEDRYSHTDLWDFAANVEGSKAAIAALRPVLEDRDPELLKTIDERFADVEELLEAQRTETGYTYYDDLSDAEIQAMSDAVAALGEPVSQVAAVVAGQ
ncbi:MAG TPA: iron uptake system protein EfeO [Nocardioidaceae bacterium]|nr:iron uptake system protein EfeO [Nocardioidaceae bacterium]